MTPEEARMLVSKDFPFKEYIEHQREAELNIAITVLSYLKPGSKILDFGSGPCDKVAILQYLGFQCSACDDLQDEWHRESDNKEKIISFARNIGIDFRLIENEMIPFKDECYFDMIMIHHVLEHFHNSPRKVLTGLLRLAKSEGILFVTIPNAVNIRKRIAVMFGRTNMPRYEDYYWHGGYYRGHVREYVRDDLVKLSKYLDLEILELRGVDHMIQRLPSTIRPMYSFVTSIFPGWKDTWLLVAKKGIGWKHNKQLS
ncbi:MAG: methyltransferase domain-containing protein [Firmicutes bacterium]|nr:methyltransferase domain-containing protein [Bacillota bacterium]